VRHARACAQEIDSTALRDVARAIVDDNLYMVLATGDADGERISVSL
jgi:hypothetical protein